MRGRKLPLYFIGELTLANSEFDINKSITIKTVIAYAIICILGVNFVVGIAWFALQHVGLVDNSNNMVLVSNIMADGLGALICASRYRKAPDPAFKISINPIMIIAIAIISIAFIDFSNNIVALTGLEKIDPFYSNVEMLLTDGSPVLVFVNAVIAAPVFEELLFRGIVYRGLRSTVSFLPAALISAALWGAMHMNFVQGVAVFLMGILFAFIYEVFRNIWITIIIHAANNAVGVLTSDSIGTLISSDILVAILCAAELAITFFICRGLWKIRKDDIKGDFDRMPSEIKSFDVE